MNLDHLRAVQAIVQEQTFGRAARRLCITQPALSMQIKTLESQIEARVFERDTRRVHLTPVGRAILRRASVILGELEAINAEIGELRGVSRGQITIACSDTVARYLLMPAIRTFVRRFPKVEITLSNKTSLEAAEAVAGMEADLGFVTMPVRAERLAAVPLLSYRDIAVCAPRHPLSRLPSATPLELHAHRLILLERGTVSRELADQLFASAGLHLVPSMELASVDVLLDMARLGLGVAIVPSYCTVHPSMRGGLAVVPIKGCPERHIALIRRPEAERTPVIAALEAIVRSVLLRPEQRAVPRRSIGAWRTARSDQERIRKISSHEQARSRPGGRARTT